MSALAELVAAYVNHRQRTSEIGPVSAGNLTSRLASLAASFGDRPTNQLNRAAIDAWRETIGHHRPATRRAYTSTVKRFCAWAVLEGHLDADPTVGLAPVKEPRRTPRALQARAVKATLAACPDARWQMVTLLMVTIGLRCCEVARLRVEDFDAERAHVTVRGKGDNERTLPVTPEVGWAIAAALAGRRSSGWLFISRKGGPVTANHVSKTMARIMYEAGVKRAPRDLVGAHSLRHTCASDVFDRTHDLVAVQELLGHQNLATTSIYLRRADPERLRQAVSGRNYALAG